MEKFLATVSILQDGSDLVIANVFDKSVFENLADKEREQLDWHVKCIASLAELALRREQLSKVVGKSARLGAQA